MHHWVLERCLQPRSVIPLLAVWDGFYICLIFEARGRNIWTGVSTLCRRCCLQLYQESSTQPELADVVPLCFCYNFAALLCYTVLD
jgi:hypothetical protein